jgi:hypothetical protein
VGARPTIVIRVTIGSWHRVRDITLRGGIGALFLFGARSGWWFHLCRVCARTSALLPNLGSPSKGRLRTTERAACWRQPEPEREAWEANPIQSKTYEITFLGQAGTTLSAEFDDCEVTIGPGTTTLRAELPDRGALSGLIERINSLGLDVIDVSLVAPPAGR